MPPRDSRKFLSAARSDTLYKAREDYNAKATLAIDLSVVLVSGNIGKYRFQSVIRKVILRAMALADLLKKR